MADSLHLVVGLSPLLVCILALLLDQLLGEVRYHPLIWFGHIAARVEAGLNNRSAKASGVCAVLLTVVPVCALAFFLQAALDGMYRFAFDAAVVYFALGWKSLREHARKVLSPLLQNNLHDSRRALAMMVSRDTGNLSTEQVSGSTVESVLENGHDGVFATLFWYALLGPSGALLHRLVNTLDAMWGYRTPRYANFGWCAARLDDFLGWPSARLTALSYALSGSLRQAISAWQAQTGKHKSPNAGLVMASGAGALRIRIGGPVSYNGQKQDKPLLGSGCFAAAQDIERSIALVNRALLVWLTGYGIVLIFLRLI